MKKILVPTDFSECAGHAAAIAVDMAKRFNAWIYFLHISPEPSVKSAVHSNVEVEAHHHEVSTAKSQLDELVRHGEQQGITCFPILVFDNGTEKIENYVKPYSIDMIAMGSHGTKGIRKLILGSNAQRVIKHADVPVLVVKQLPDSFALRTFLYASSFKDDVSVNFLWMARLSGTLNAQLNLLYLADANDPVPEDQALEQMREVASGYTGLNYALHYAITNDLEWAIRNVAEKIRADIIAVSLDEKEKGVLSTNLATKLLNEADRPFLVVNL